MLYIMLDPFRWGCEDSKETNEISYQEWADGLCEIIYDSSRGAFLVDFIIFENDRIKYNKFTGPIKAMYWRDGLVHLITDIGDITVKKDC